MRKLDMTKLAQMETANDLLDKKYGKEGTASRAEFDAASQAWYDSQISASYHITMPKALHDSLTAFAKDKGTSISALINKLVAKELKLAY